MEETEQRLRQEVEELLRRAAAADEAEDAQYGKGKRGDELPAELARRESRLKKIREAKTELEKEAREKAEKQRAEAQARIAERREQEAQTGKKAGGHDPKVPDPEQAKPEAKAQRNFTDPDSRIMPDGANKGSFVQAYNAQAAVDGEAQVIVAAELTQQTNDSRQLVPMIEQVIANMGCKPEVVSADAGYWSEANGRRRTEPRPKRRCSINCGPRRGSRSTKCVRPSWNRSLARSKNGAGCGVSASVVWAMWGWSGS
jgi:hypothetical protein